MKILDWVKCWNYLLLVPCIGGVIASFGLAAVIDIFAHDGPVPKKDEIYIFLGCVMVFLVFALPFLGTMYTSSKFIALKQKDSSKFGKLMKTRQYFYILFDLAFIVSIFLRIIGNDNGMIFFEFSGVFVVF